MKVIKTSDVEAQEATSQLFRGKVSRQPIISESEAGLRVGVVHFTPGAVNVFHMPCAAAVSAGSG